MTTWKTSDVANALFSQKERVDARMREFKPHFDQLLRNGRWGTCCDCPKSSDYVVLPELCVNANRYDHLLTAQELFDQWIQLDPWESKGPPEDLPDHLRLPLLEGGM